MDAYSQKFPKLYNFFAGSFHNFWPDMCRKSGDEPSTKIVVREYKLENHRNTINQAIHELEKLISISINMNEKNIRNVVVRDLGANINPSVEGLTYRQWLEEVLRILREK
jgi:CdiI immunity protein